MQRLAGAVVVVLLVTVLLSISSMSRSIAHAEQQYIAVMIGDSITYGGNWPNLAKKYRVINRGIWGGRTSGVLHRLAGIYELEPEIAFVMIGINDIADGKSVQDIFANYQQLVIGLMARNIRPIIQSTLPVARQFKPRQHLNDAVFALNKRLKHFAAGNGLLYIDIARKISRDGYLDHRYTDDGLHLNKRGYEAWDEEIAASFK